MRQKVHSYIYLIGLMLVAFFMPLSLFVTNASILMIITNWFIECNYMEKWHRLKENKTALIFCAIFLVHIIWLVNTSNYAYAANDIRVKLPLLALPLALATSRPLTPRKLHIILLSFISGVFVASLLGLSAKLFGNSLNFRALALFVSNIRLSLMLCFSAFILAYFAFKKIFFTRKTSWIAILVALWLLIFMSMIQSMTGYACFIITLVVVLTIVGIKSKKQTYKWICLTSALIIPLSICGIIAYFVQDFYSPTCENIQLEKTAAGIPYDDVKSDGTIENGNTVWMNVCKSELTSAWSERSTIPLDSLDNRGQCLYSTLVRYMTSRGLTKDAAGVSQLSDADVLNIENGETNYRFVGHGGIIARIYVIIWEFDVYNKLGDCNGHSATQRIEYQKYGWKLAMQNVFTGTGEGDVNDEYQALYEELDSHLQIENRHRAHNQFLTFFIAFGIFGLLICLFAWFYPAIKGWTIADYYFGIFFLIATISMFSDDTLETSTGAVFVAFFYSLLKWTKKTKNENYDQRRLHETGD